MDKLIIYIAGPMRGIKYFNFPAFDEARDHLAEAGFAPISPADLDRERGVDALDLPEDYDWNTLPTSLDLGAIAQHVTKIITQCHGVYMLNGWANSKGALAEKALAEWLGVRVLYQSLENHLPPASELCMRWDDETFWSWHDFVAGKVCTVDCSQNCLGPEPPKDILEEALEVTRGDRQAAYGPPDQDFRRTAGMWSALFGDMLRDGVEFEPFHVAQAMILLKMSRLTHARKRDSVVDIAGYARCMDVCYEADGGY